MIIGSLEEDSNKKNQLINLVIRVPKEESAFIYFTLEANEGLCFYSTLPYSNGEGYRDIDLKTHITLEKELIDMIHFLGEKSHISLLKKDVINEMA